MRSGFLGIGKKTPSSETDPYDSFASVYDRWQDLYTRPFSLAMTIRIQQAWEEFGVPEQSLLDFACGTGTLAWWWSEHNPAWEVVGVDRSAPMIERALRKADGEVSEGGQDVGSTAGAGGTEDAGDVGKDSAGRNLHPRRVHASLPPSSPSFHVGDISRLSLSDLRHGSGFGMVTCFFDSLNHITKTKELEGALRSARRCLLPGGLFVFDLIDVECFPEIFGSPWIVQNDHLYVGCESEYLERRGASYGRVHFTFFERSGEKAESSSWKRSETEILERAWPREVFDPMVDAAGLEIIHVQLIDPEEQPDVFVPRRLYVCRPKN